MTSRLHRRLHALLSRIGAEDGQGLAEYALVLGLVAAACIGAMTLLGSAIAGSSGFVDLPGVL